jgi:hypothetical protein
LANRLDINFIIQLILTYDDKKYYATKKIQFLVYKFSKETEMICMGANILPIRRRGAK